jgi:hypothetical protein
MLRGWFRGASILVSLWAAVYVTSADAGVAPAATATAVSISVPGVDAVTTPGASLSGEASVTATNWSSSADSPVVATGTESSALTSDSAGTAAQVQLQDVQLFGGELTLSALQVTASQPADGSPATVTSEVGDIVLDGTAIPAPAPGDAPTALADWGELSVAATLSSGELVGVRVLVTATHAGLPAGSEIDLGLVSFDQAPAGGGDAGQGSSGGTPTGPPVSPGLHHHRHGHAPPAPPLRRHRRSDVHHPLHLPDLGRGVRATIVRMAARQIGWPYVWGGDSREEGGFDCSGLVDYAFAAAGHPLAGRPTAAVLWQMGVPIARRNLRPGDLVFLGTRSGQPYHVALYAGDDKVIVASGRNRPIAAEPLDAVAWDGYARIWAPGGLTTMHPRHPSQPIADPADLIAAQRVLEHHLTAAQPQPASPAMPIAPVSVRRRQPRPAPEPRSQPQLLPADPRMRAGTGRPAFALPSA